MVAWVRVLANPKVLKRFLRTKAGRKAAFKYGNMLLNSKMIQNAISKFMHKNGKSLSGNKKYAAQQKEFAKMQQKIAALEAQIEKNKDDQIAMQTATFTMGRQVIEMQRLYAQMQMELQKMQQDKMILTAQHTR